ncbi:MAG TPA: M23 family metallopeptidase [Pyrinomonadaceae bacterium]|jgi:murein DD-endopeptidase MepM/ murein hydrolase activator NlpD|nr:M23 family metallopeptidase [Pyrinomonadaceae bacterium]
MPKDDRYYTFTFTRSSRSHISIRRIEFSKRNFQIFACSLLVVLGVSSATLFRYADSIYLTRVNAQLAAENERNKQELAMLHQQVEKPAAVAVTQQDFTDRLVRPGDGKGGPESAFDLSQQSEDKEAGIIEQLAVIEKNPEWAIYSPSAWPHLGKINNEFGFRRNPFGGRRYEFHPGMDIDGEQGEIAYAAGGGTVIKAGRQGGYGNMIEVDHGNGITSRYGHLSRIDVAIGDKISRGDQLGAIGTTGRSTGPHLHFEVRFNDEALNPRRFLPVEPKEFARK